MTVSHLSTEIDSDAELSVVERPDLTTVGIEPYRIDRAPVQTLVMRMTATAAAAAGGDLARLHTRASVDGLEAKIREAVRPFCAELLGLLAGPEALIQGTPNVRIHRPRDLDSVIPFHSDVLYGHSEHEVNYWVNLTPAFGTNSLWMVGGEETRSLHHGLKYDRLSLAEFEALARRAARPIGAPAPGAHTFCCAQIHGSVLNETDSTRVSIDLRTLGAGCRANVKRRGGYFRPQWLTGGECPLAPGTAATTVASLDEGTPVYLQRVAIQSFYPQRQHRELVEFHGLPHHSPTLADALARGPVVAYTIRQLKEVPALSHPIGFADERVWITPGQTGILERFMREVNGAARGA